jgi:ABC-type iron transport system FetAB permease component
VIFSENRDKVEMYLAFGASRFEACKPIATEALRLALTPTINQMRCVLSVSPVFTSGLIFALTASSVSSQFPV